MITDTKQPVLKSPFPWFGGKSSVADMVWKRFGKVNNYIEPFFGSGAMLFGRPQPFKGVETVNDIDGLVCNFWRALQNDPEGVAFHADYPVNENDLHARHAWLVAKKDSLQSKLEGDPNYYDVKIAGWWCWGLCCWIGRGFCSGKGPWQRVQQDDGTWQLVHIGDAGRGVTRQLVHLSDAGMGVNGRNGIKEWMNALADRLARVRVCCGDWTRVCGGKSGNALNSFLAGGNKCAIFLDPPYADTAERDSNIYRCDCLQVAHNVKAWAVEHGDDERLQIALCGYEGEHDMPDSWECVEWKAQGGYSNQSDNKNQNCKKERIWFSKYCLKPTKIRMLF